MVGNDIIDVRKAREEFRQKHPRFIGKLFTAAEQSYIEESSDRILMLWRLWSIKESAYKLFIQQGGQRFFNPQKIKCVVDGNDSLASIDAFSCKVTSKITSDYIFSYTPTPNDSVISKQIQMESINRLEQSKALCFLLREEVSKHLNLSADEVSIKKNTKGVPLLYVNNTRLNYSMSLSHHGNFGAYSICKS